MFHFVFQGLGFAVKMHIVIFRASLNEHNNLLHVHQAFGVPTFIHQETWGTALKNIKNNGVDM
jgi:hypothetical protein